MEIFLSHSSNDKTFVRRLASDLEAAGHTPWLDERAIRVGASIVTEVAKGLSSARFVIVVLSKSFVESAWCANEWEAVFFQSMRDSSVILIPVLLEDCAIPTLLRHRKYADFRTDYDNGLREVMDALAPIFSGGTNAPGLPRLNAAVVETGTLLAKVQARSAPLAECLSEGTVLAQRHNDADLDQFCRRELAGWTLSGIVPAEAMPPYRVVEMYISCEEINIKAIVWRNVQDVFAYMRQNPNRFIPYRTIIPEAVPQLESRGAADPTKAIIHHRTTAGYLLGAAAAPHPEMPMWFYGRADSYQIVLEAIRQKLTELLLERLPRLETTLV